MTVLSSRKVKASGRREARRPLIATAEQQRDGAWRMMVTARDVGTLASPAAAKQFIEKIKRSANGRRGGGR